jgi:hypothetical protein
VDAFLEGYPYFFPFFFVALWVFTLSIIARVGGWSELADRYRADAVFEGEMLRFQSIALRRWRFMPMGMNHVVAIGADQTALKLSLFILFRPGHPPLSIPWSDVEAAPEKMLGFLPRVQLTVRGAPEVKILISPKQATWLAGHAAIPALWPSEFAQIPA